MAERVLSLEREADDAEAREDDETAAAVAAAGAEIDAFLAHAVPNPNDDANDDDPTFDDERTIGRRLRRYGRAKAALEALVERLERVQLEMDALEEEETASGGGPEEADEIGFGECVPGAALVADPRVPERRRLETRAAETAAEIATRRRELARLAPEVQRAREELMDATMETGTRDASLRDASSRSRRAKNDAAARKEEAAARVYAAARRDASVRASTRREMRRERDAECLRARVGREARGVRSSQRRTRRCVGGVGRRGGDGPGATRGRCSSSARTQGIDGRGDGVRGDVLGGAAIRARGAYGVSTARGGGFTGQGNQPARDVSSSRRGGARGARGTTRRESARRARGGDSVAPTTRGG